MLSSSSRPGRRADPATRRRRQQRLLRSRRSGLTVPAFCDREGVSAASSYAWRRRPRHNPAASAPEPPRLAPVRLVTPATAAPVELLLPSGLVLRLASEIDPGRLRRLLGLVGVAPC